MKNEYKGKLWKQRIKEKHDVVCGIAARGKIKKELNKKAKEIYNIGVMLVEFLGEKVYNTGIFKFV